jgi:hypothetical protein
VNENPNQGGYQGGYPAGYGGNPGYGYAPPWPPARRRSRVPIYVGLGLVGLVLTIVVGVLLINAGRPGTPTATIVYRLVPADGRQITDADLDETVQILQHRLNSAGDVPGTVEKLPPDMVSVRLYGETYVPALSDKLGAPGRFLFVLLPRATYGDVTAPSTTPLPAEGSMLDPELLKTAQFNGSELDPNGTSAAEDPNTPGYWLVNFAFKGEYANQFAVWSGQHINEYFAMVLDGKILSVPYIKDAITGGKGVISGGFTASDAKWMAVMLSYGALPFPLQDVSRAVSPSGSPSACASPTGELELRSTPTPSPLLTPTPSSSVRPPTSEAAAATSASASAAVASASASAAAASASASAAVESAASASASASADEASASKAC